MNKHLFLLISLISIFSFSSFAQVDPDIKRAQQLGYLNPDDTSFNLFTFQDESGAKWKLQVFTSLANPNGPAFFVPHDSENEAFLTGAWAISVYGGVLLALDCHENRMCGKIDPNRHFLDSNHTYVSSILNFFKDRSYPVITLHNNHDSHHSLGGSGAIYADLPVPYTDGTGIYHDGDPDDLIIYADTSPIGKSETFAFFDQELGLRKINSIFEHIRQSNALGGHMSTYVIRNTPLQYFNVEAQHGHLREQKSILKGLLEILAITE